MDMALYYNFYTLVYTNCHNNEVTFLIIPNRQQM